MQAARSKLWKTGLDKSRRDGQEVRSGLFCSRKQLTCFIHFKDDMEEVIHILLALAVILLVERLVQAGNV